MAKDSIQINYRKFAKKIWGKHSCWIDGEGPWALLAHCHILSVSLWQTEAKALASKKQIDETACGGQCVRAHEIRNLNPIIQTELKK